MSDVQPLVPSLFNKFGRKPFSHVLRKGLKYVENRKTGRIKSFRTPWKGFNAAGIAGLEWGSMLTIGARPGAGKTMLVSQILRESRKLNPDQDFNILEFQFEMGDEQYAARQFAGATRAKYGEILSTDKALNDFVFNQVENYVRDCEALEKLGVKRELVSESLTSEQIEQAITQAYKDWGDKPIIVTIDHSWLIKKDPTEREKLQTLYNTTEMLMKLKNRLPIIIIMITQLNRSIDDPLRKKMGDVGNYPTAGDIFGGDALMQGSDMIAILARPFKNDIPLYGPFQYICKKEDVILHLIKNRNSDNDIDMVFLRMDGAAQEMVEVPEFPKNKPGGNAPSKYPGFGSTS